MNESNGLKLSSYKTVVTSLRNTQATYIYSYLENTSSNKVCIVIGSGKGTINLESFERVKAFAHTVQKRLDGKYIKEPLARIGYLELMPKQITQLPTVVLEGDLAEGEVFTVYYHVEPEMFDLYNVWVGKLKAEPEALTMLQTNRD
ncbi:hypothetical protein MLD52_22205 [Puniceicoccaceae bacterium K14]|nr:hypothetical protein [Puniceicoccaceae bacterium K14]